MGKAGPSLAFYHMVLYQSQPYKSAEPASYPCYLNIKQ